MRKSFTFLASIFVLVLSLSVSIIAQQTAGGIQGTVTDPNGAVVPGASVAAKGIDVGFNRTVTTVSNGQYRFTQLPPGRYQVTIAPVQGFVAQTKENVEVGLNNTTTTDFALGLQTSAVVDVTGEGVLVDATDTKAQTNISAREIEALPKGTGYTSLLKTTVSVRPEPLGGQFSINGATGPENSFIVDGQETQNFATGLLNTNQDIPYQAVQEIQVKSSGFEAEFGGATGGVINAVTKSGSNEFHGEFGFNMNTQKLNAGPRAIPSLTTGLTAATGETVPGSTQGLETRPLLRDNGTNFYPTALLSGAIIKDKLWFFGIHSPRIVNEERTTTFTQGFGPTRQPTIFSPLLRSLNADHTQTYSRKTTYNYSQLRLDAAPLDSLRISSSYVWNPIVQSGNILAGSFVTGSPATLVVGNTTYQGAEAARFQGGRQNASSLRLEGVWTPTSNLVILGRYTRGFQNEKLGSYGVPFVPQFICQNVPTGVEATAGCAQGFANVSSNSVLLKNISIRTAYDVQATYLFNALGHHELKGGYQNSTIFNDIESGNRGPGRTYLFYADPLDSTHRYRCFTPTETYVQWSISDGNTYPCPTNSIGTGVTYQFASSGSATNKANTFFVQDKWQVTSRLTLNLGLRTEEENIPSFAENSINLKFKYLDKLAPRLGAAYALTDDGKTKLSAFYGRFFDRLKFALPQGSFGGQFYHVSYFHILANAPTYTNYTVGSLAGTYTFPGGGSCPNPSGSVYLCDQDYRIPSNAINGNIFETGGVDENVKPYRQSEVTVEFQRELMRSSVLTARFLYRNLDQTIEDIGIPTPDGGEAYVIGNPGSGLAADLYKQLGYNKIPKAVRKYKALQVEYDTRYFRNLNLNMSYTLSRLTGNFSGLASPDEVSVTTGTGRSTTPNTNRDFDEPWVGFTASGQEAVGILPLDRTHVFKASGNYTFDWRDSKSNSTDLGFFTTAESGTPITTFVNIMGIPIPQTERGDKGRLAMFTQTDLNLSHRYKFGRDNRFAVIGDINVINVFNENAVVAVNQNLHSAAMNLSNSLINNCPTIVCATNYLTSNGVLTQYAAREAVLGPRARNIAFLQPIAYQETRAIRFGFRFLF